MLARRDPDFSWPLIAPRAGFRHKWSVCAGICKGLVVLSLKSRIHSVTAKTKRNAFALSAIGMFSLSIYAGLRDLGGSPDIRRQLIGTWQHVGVINAGREWPIPESVGPKPKFTLHDDGRATYEGDDHQANWRLGDARHLHIVHRFPPDPNRRGMQDGASEDEMYEIITFSPKRLVVRTFDVESDIIWQRVGEESHAN
jgi:hypothetical protein